MSQEHIGGLRADLDAFNSTGEINTDRLVSDFEMQQASSIVDTAGTFVGREGMRDSFRELHESFEDLSFEGEGTSTHPEAKSLSSSECGDVAAVAA